MDASISKNLLASLPEVKIFDLQLVDGHCITPFDIYHVTPEGKNSFVRALAFPGTSREYAILIDKADLVSNLSDEQSTCSIWIDLELDGPTLLSEALGAAIESKCRERHNTRG